MCALSAASCWVLQPCTQSCDVSACLLCSTRSCCTPWTAACCQHTVPMSGPWASSLWLGVPAVSSWPLGATMGRWEMAQGTGQPCELQDPDCSVSCLMSFSWLLLQVRLLNHVTWKMITEFGHPAAISNPKTVSLHASSLKHVVLTFLSCCGLLPLPAPSHPFVRACVVQAPLRTVPLSSAGPCCLPSQLGSPEHLPGPVLWAHQSRADRQAGKGQGQGRSPGSVTCLKGCVSRTYRKEQPGAAGARVRVLFQ